MSLPLLFITAILLEDKEQRNRKRQLNPKR